VMKELKRHKKESERVQLQQQLSIRGLKEQVNLAQQALQQQVIVQFFWGINGVRMIGPTQPTAQS